MTSSSHNSKSIQPSSLRRRDLLASAAGLGLASLLGGGIRTAEAATWPSRRGWANASPASVGVDPGLLMQAINYAKREGKNAGSGIVVVGGKRIAYWGDQNAKYKLFSATKSFGSAMLGLAIDDGKARLDGRCRDSWSEFGVPPSRNNRNGWAARITVEQLATHTAGFEKTGGFIPLFFKPGTKWSYSDGSANWLADFLTVRYGRDLATVLRARIFDEIGISASDLKWRRNAYRPATLNGVTRREFGSGIDSNVDALARFGLLMARRGEWNGKQLIPRALCPTRRRPAPCRGGCPVDQPADLPERGSALRALVVEQCGRRDPGPAS